MASLQTGAMNVTSLHIALVSETFPPEVNGVAHTLARLVDGLRLRGHRVELIRPRQSGDARLPASDDLLLNLMEGRELIGVRFTQRKRLLDRFTNSAAESADRLLLRWLQRGQKPLL